MRIVLASHNRGKIAELQSILSVHFPDVEILSPEQVGFYEDIEETGASFSENALIKAQALVRSGYISVGDDSGLCVRALNGAPGIYSARYAGEHGDDAANLDLLLHNMADQTDRAAAFYCCIACAFPDGREPIVCEGVVEGELLHARRGEGGFGYDPIFYYPPFEQTFGEMSAADKNKISHRARALEAFAAELNRQLR